MPLSGVKQLFLVCAMMAFAAAQAETQMVGGAQTHGTLVTISATGEVTHANDEAHATLQVEEQDKDKAEATSRANLKMKQGIDIVKREDPSAMLKTRGYYTYPVYAAGMSSSPLDKLQKPIGWRVGQYLELTTTDLEHLPKTVAAAQKLLALNGLRFDLAPATLKKLDRERIEAAYRNLTERLASVAAAMGRNAADAVLDTVDFDGGGNNMQPQVMALNRAMESKSAPVEEPSFEPGETRLQLQMIGKFTFK